MAERKVRIQLDQIAGMENCFLEIEPHDNGDIYLTMRGQDDKGEAHTIRAQLLGPFGGTRNQRSYDILVKLYNEAGR